MRKLAIVALLVLGCRQQQTVPRPVAPGTPGAETPREAVQQFMAAAKSENLEAMANVWGSAQGPAHATMSRQVWEQRLIVMIGCLKHDSYQIARESPGTGGDRLFEIEIRFRDLTRRSNFTATRSAVSGSAGRWLVQDFDIQQLSDICSRRA